MSMRVDLLVGKRRVKIDGISRYYGEVQNRITKEVDFRVIDFIGSRSTPVDKARSLFQYPFIVNREKREGSIKHLTSMVEAYLLNYLELKPSIVTCYDIFPLLPDAYPFLERNLLRFAARGMLKADKIVTISNFSKREISDRFGYPLDNISVVYPGVDLERYKPMPRRKDIKEKFGWSPDTKIILYVGMEQPRKNLSTLVRAFGRLRRNGVDAKLLKVGRPYRAEDRKELLESIEEQGLLEDVVVIDYIIEEELPYIYNSADLFVFPSIYEGFGLPPLEAMACGCPVITSNAASLPEVVGDAAIMLDPHDVEGLTGKMQDVLQDTTLREELKEKGLRQAGRFSWDKTALETLDVYREVVESNPIAHRTSAGGNG